MWPPAREEGSGASWKYSRSSQPTAKLPNELRSAWLSLVASDPDETLSLRPTDDALGSERPLPSSFLSLPPSLPPPSLHTSQPAAR